MKFKLTGQEKKWILYDVGNSAFILLVSTIIPIYFNALAENAGLSSVKKAFVCHHGPAWCAGVHGSGLSGKLVYLPGCFCPYQSGIFRKLDFL